MADAEISPEARRALVQANLAPARLTTIAGLTDDDLATLSLDTIMAPCTLEESLLTLRNRHASAAEMASDAELNGRKLRVNELVGQVFGERDPNDRRACHGSYVNVSTIREDGVDVYVVRYCVFPNCGEAGLTGAPDRRIVGAVSYALVRNRFGGVTYREKFAHAVAARATWLHICSKVSNLDEFFEELHVAFGIPRGAATCLNVVTSQTQGDAPSE